MQKILTKLNILMCIWMFYINWPEKKMLWKQNPQSDQSSKKKKIHM